MHSEPFPIGSQVTIAGAQAVTGEVIETRPGHCKCSLLDGRAVWVPVAKLSLADGTNPVARAPESDGFEPRAVAATKAGAPSSTTLAERPIPWAWLGVASVVTIACCVMAPRAGFDAWSSALVSLLLFGVFAIWKKNRTLHTAARVFVVVGGLSLVTYFGIAGGEPSNTAEVNAQIQARMQELAESTNDDDTPGAVEARRLEAIEWALGISRGKDAKAYAALADLQKLNVQLADELDEATAALDFRSAPPGLTFVDSPQGLAEQAKRLQRHAVAVDAWLTHCKNGPGLFEKLAREHGVSDEAFEQLAAIQQKSMPARIAHYEQLAAIDAIHAQLHALLQQEWGGWKYDAVTRSVAFSSPRSRGRYDALLGQLRQAAGVDATERAPR